MEPKLGGQGEAILEISGLEKRFGDRVAVDRLDLFLEHGECLALLGPNGAGKTTTIRAILGLVRPSGGTIRVFGQDAAKRLKQIKMRIGVVPQMDNLDPDLTVIENLMVYASYFRIPRKVAAARAEELLSFLALNNRRDEIIQHLSGGQRRRILLARALINGPELLILDEPTVGLDPQARYLIWERLLSLRDNGTTMLLTSHYMEEVSRLASRVVILDQGRKIAAGPPDEIVADIIGAEVMEVIGDGKELDRLADIVEGCQVSVEKAPDRLFIYIKKGCRELDQVIRQFPHVVKRPATLEDLFIKLTGRKLRET